MASHVAVRTRMRGFRRSCSNCETCIMPVRACNNWPLSAARQYVLTDVGEVAQSWTRTLPVCQPECHIRPDSMPSRQALPSAPPAAGDPSSLSMGSPIIAPAFPTRLSTFAGRIVAIWSLDKFGLRLLDPDGDAVSRKLMMKCDSKSGCMLDGNTSEYHDHGS